MRDPLPLQLCCARARTVRTSAQWSHAESSFPTSRADGRGLAEALERRLLDETGIHSWRDLKSMGSGDIRPQVLRAIEQVQHLVLILSRRALVSHWVKREWTHARERGRMVSPVLADPTLKRADLPGWMRRSETYEIADPERWLMPRQVLAGPGETRRVSRPKPRRAVWTPIVAVDCSRFCYWYRRGLQQ